MILQDHAIARLRFSTSRLLRSNSAARAKIKATELITEQALCTLRPPRETIQAKELRNKPVGKSKTWKNIENIARSYYCKGSLTSRLLRSNSASRAKIKATELITEQALCTLRPPREMIEASELKPKNCTLQSAKLLIKRTENSKL